MLLLELRPPNPLGILLTIGLYVAIGLGVWAIVSALAKVSGRKPPSLTALLMLLGIMGAITFLWVFVLWFIQVRT